MKLPKLIVSDLDGTLGPEGISVLPADLVETLDRLQELGIPFAACSGRQAASLEQVFSSLAKPPMIMALNGGSIFRDHELIYEEPLPQAAALDIARDAAMIPGVNVILETSRMCWVYGRENVLDHTLSIRKYQYQIIEDLHEVQGKVIKVACYTEGDIDGLQHWSEQHSQGEIKAARSGQCWVDFNVADKGKGLRSACKLLGIEPEEVIAFGDNLNDEQMLCAAGTGYAVEGSILAGTGNHPTCPSVKEVLKKICEEAEKTLAF